MGLIENLYRILSDRIYFAFIKEDRFMYLVDGWKVSVQLTVIAAILGIFIGMFVAIAKITGKPPFAQIADWYISIIRGTPAVVQLTIIYFIILADVNLPKTVVASIAFGINSGAYVAEIIRSGIQAVDKGQAEAGRSLGLSYSKTMQFIIIPQAIKNILPALGNEFIILLKETSISGYIALADLTQGATLIKSATYDAMTPLFTVAYIYFLMTAMLSVLLAKFERRLHSSD
ncbi:MAG TPA: amino acid ABC transporter permease [Clostridiaceae bacterium]|jgi:His/Glu/Gln/Arg/opine family amino acid ABC transporter permease subunit|nr:amino acid ABC transporter permease [Clostridiaceae bacterium]